MQSLDTSGLATLILSQVGFGGTLGFLLGYGLKKVAAIVLKIIALISGLFMLGLTWLAWIGVISINFNTFANAGQLIHRRHHSPSRLPSIRRPDLPAGRKLRTRLLPRRKERIDDQKGSLVQGAFFERPYVEHNDRNSLVAFLAENEILKHLANFGYDRGVKSIVLAVELCLAFHAPQFDVRCLLTHYQYFTIEA